MSIRRQLYAIQAELPGGDSVERMQSLSLFLKSLPEGDVADVERRLLALAIVMRDVVSKNPTITLDEVSTEVDAVVRRMSN